MALIHTVIKASLTQAKKSQLVSTNVAEAAKLPQQKKPEKRALSTTELNTFLEAASTHRLYPAIVLAATTGLRRGELLALRWDDIDFDQSVLFVRRGLVLVTNAEGPTKTKLVEQPTKTQTGNRAIPVPKPVLRLLKDHQKVQDREKLIQGHRYKDKGLVFSTITGNYISPRNFTRTFAQIRKKAGLEGVSPHVLRHTFATRLSDLGVHPRVAQQLLGHANMQLTMEVYTHPDMQQRLQAVGEGRRFLGFSPVAVWLQ